MTTTSKARQRAYARKYYRTHRKARLAYACARQKLHPEDPEVKRLRAAKYREAQRTNILAVLKRRLLDARKRAIAQGVVCDLTLAQLVTRYNEQPQCAITGLPFELGTKWATISVDRVVADGDYTLANIRLVRFQVNIALQNWGEEPFREMCAAVVANSKLKQE